MPLIKEEGLRQSSRSMGVEKLKMLQWVLGKGWNCRLSQKGSWRILVSWRNGRKPIAGITAQTRTQIRF